MTATIIRFPGRVTVWDKSRRVEQLLFHDEDRELVAERVVALHQVYPYARIEVIYPCPNTPPPRKRGRRIGPGRAR